MITPARRKNLYEEISNQIIDMISDGTWKQGERIPGEVELSGMFQVSRNSVRESVKALELIGLLRAKSGSGTYVSDNAMNRIRQIRMYTLPEEESSILEVMEARLVMEPSLVRMAAAKATAEDLDALQDILDVCTRAFAEKDYDFELGYSFHYNLFRMSGNRILLGIFEELKERLVSVRRRIFFKHIDENVLLKELGEHRQILHFIREGKGDEAAKLMERHLAESVEWLRKKKV